MKKPIIINRALMDGALPEPPERFMNQMNQMIDQLPKRGTKPVKKKISTAAIALAVLLLLCATGLAIGLTVEEIWKQSFDKMNTTAVHEVISIPEEDDMTADEAIALAKEAIRNKYGTTDEEFERMGVYPAFYARGWDGKVFDDPAEWQVYFSSRTDVNLDLDTLWYGPDGEYRVYINAETGEIMYCNWYTNDFWSKAQRIWDCGSHDVVYSKYKSSSFYSQSKERQAHFEKLLADAGYALIEHDQKYHDLLLGKTLDLKFHDPMESISPGTDAQADAAWLQLQLNYSLDPELLQKYAYEAVRLDLNTGTDDICIAFNFEEQFNRVDTGILNRWVNTLFDDVDRIGLFMVSFEPGTTNVVEVTHVLRSEEMRDASITEGELLERNDWTSRELYLFDEAYTQLEWAIARMDLAGATDAEKEIVKDAYMRSLGGDPDIYTDKSDEYDVWRWFEGDPVTDENALTATAAVEQYGRNVQFWPMEIQAKVLSDGSLYSMPKEDEMTREEAVEKAINAVKEAYGEEALAALGDYKVGCLLIRFSNNGESTRWQVYITDDPDRMENGWRVIFVDKNKEYLGDDVQIYDIADPGNG